MSFPSLTNLTPGAALATPDEPEELDVAQLAEMLVVAGILTTEQSEALMGEDFDDDLEWWADDGPAAAAGINVQLRNTLIEQQKRRDDKEYREQQDEFERTGKWPKPEKHDPKDNARGKYEAIMARACDDTKQEAVSKAVGSTSPRGGKYVARHLTSGGNWAYSYSTTGARLDNKPKASSTGNPAGQLHKEGSSTSKSSVAQGQSYNVRFKGKTKKVTPKNEKEARGLARMLAAKKVAKDD